MSAIELLRLMHYKGRRRLVPSAREIMALAFCDFVHMCQHGDAVPVIAPDRKCSSCRRVSSLDNFCGDKATCNPCLQRRLEKRAVRKRKNEVGQQHEDPSKQVSLMDDARVSSVKSDANDEQKVTEKRRCSTCKSFRQNEFFIHGKVTCTVCLERRRKPKEQEEHGMRRCSTCRSYQEIDKFDKDRVTCTKCLMRKKRRKGTLDQD